MFSREYWDNVYGRDLYLFGEKPNSYFAEKLNSLEAGKILIPAEGEGRNAVYAAQNNWKVIAFDLSETAKSKALSLAKKNGVQIEYKTGDLSELDFDESSFDALALIFAHFDPEKRSEFHKKLSSFVKKAGFLILYAFGNGKAINQDFSNPLYYDLEELKKDFEDFEFVESEEIIEEAKEGVIINGNTCVIKLFGIKK